MTYADVPPEAFMALLDALETDRPVPELQPADAADLMFARQLLAFRARPAAPLRPPWLAAQVTAPDTSAELAGSPAGQRRSNDDGVLGIVLSRLAARLRPDRHGSSGARTAGRPARVEIAVLAGVVAVVTLIFWSTSRQLGQNGEDGTVPAVAPATSTRLDVAGSPAAVVASPTGMPPAPSATPTGMPPAPSATSTTLGVAAYPPPLTPPTDGPAPPTSVATAAPPSPPPAPRERPAAPTTPVPTDESAYPGPLATATPAPMVTRVAPPPVPTAPPTDTAVVPTPPATSTSRPAPPTPTAARSPDAVPPDRGTTVRASLDAGDPPRHPIPVRRMPQ